MSEFFISGDLGDACAAIPIVRHLGGGELIVGPHVGRGGPREPMTEARANFLLPLITGQPFVTSARFAIKPNTIAHDLSMFRVSCLPMRGELLTHWMARHLRIRDFRQMDLSPWLAVAASDATRGKVVVSRSLRYHNPKFNWNNILKPHKGGLVFVGLPEEHAAFQSHAGLRADYRPVANALEMAELIAGSDLFVGNQSFPCWVAMAMGHPLIQETWIHSPNSLIPRINASFVK